MSKTVYQMVTDRIIAELEKGNIPWEKPWTGVQSEAISGTTGKPYSLLNQMLLGKPGEWYTFNQVKQLGGMVRKGEKSSFVVFWKQTPVKEENPETGEIKEKLVPMLRYYNVFHVDQCEGIKAKIIDPEAVDPATLPADEIADHIIVDYLNRSGVTLEHIKGDEAYYSPAFDRVVLPLREQFPDMAEYYSTAFHELTHSTGHSNRLNRLTSTAHFGNESYSKEELVAEIGAAALVNHACIETKNSFRNSTAYIQSWLKVLRGDSRFIVSAASKAEKAVNYILGNA